MDKEIISYIDANGREFELKYVLKGLDGRFMPPVSYVEDEIPFQYGSRARQLKVAPREVDLPFLIKGASRQELRTKVREIINTFNPMIGDGRLQVTSYDGSQRELYCRYAGGLEFEESGLNFQKFILVLRAFDPFWYDTNTIVETFTIGEPATFFPMFPLRLSSSTVFADTTIENSGDVETWPEWIIKGPGEKIIFYNLTTGEKLFLNTSLLEGETITIDLKPGKKTIKKNDGTNLFGTLTDDSTLWALQQGVNNIRIEMSNATLQSSVQLSYKNRYLGA